MTALSPSLSSQLDDVIRSNPSAEKLGRINLEFMASVGLALTMDTACDKSADGIHQQVINLRLKWATGTRREDAKQVSLAVVGNPDNYHHTLIRQGAAVRSMIYPAFMTTPQAKEIYCLEK